MKLVFCGDSLMQNNDETTYPQVGWPQVFKTLVKDNIGYLNTAINGRSTKSFKDTGLLHVAYTNTNKGDLVFISFGHNDEKKEDPTRYTSYLDYYNNLKYIVSLFKKRGANIILITPMTRLNYIDGVLTRTHQDYPKMMKKVALEEKVELIDLEEYSFNYLSKRTFEENKEYYMSFKSNIYPNYIDGKDDHTHLREKGALLVSNFIKKELEKNPKYKEIFK